MTDLSDRLNVTGQVVRVEGQKILLRLSGLLDDDEQWLDIPPQFPEWAMGGNVFYATIPPTVETWDDLIAASPGLIVTQPSPSSQMTHDESMAKLKRLSNEESQ